jgi:hypothetical protein
VARPTRPDFPHRLSGLYFLWVPVGGTKLTKQDVELVTNLILDYFGAVKYVRQKSKLAKEEKLQRLINPLIKLNKILAPLHSLPENPYRRFDGTYPFICERVYKDDLDLDHLEYNKSRYSINWCENDRIPARRGPRICLYETEEERRLREEVRSKEEARRGIELEDSLIKDDYPESLYPAWLPTLDEEKIQSRDLLDQILVCYTIKRAINGDKKAVEKLYSLYEDAAEGMGVKFAHRTNQLGVNLDVNEAKNISKVLLRFIIEGFSPERIIRDIFLDSKGMFFHIPGWVKNFFIYYCSEYLPPRIQAILKELESVKQTGQKNRFTTLLYFKLLVLLNPYTPIRDGEKSPVISRKFNTYCFRPGAVKMGPYYNLSTWIFGGRKDIDALTKSKREDGTIAKACQPYGKLYQLIRDEYRLEIKGHKAERTFDFLDDPEEDQGRLSLKEKNKALSSKEKRFDKPPGEIIAKLTKRGISQRDAEIFTKWKFPRSSKEFATQEKIAREFKLSRRQIIRICRRIAESFKPSL